MTRSLAWLKVVLTKKGIDVEIKKNLLGKWVLSLPPYCRDGF